MEEDWQADDDASGSEAGVMSAVKLRRCLVSLTGRRTHIRPFW